MIPTVGLNSLKKSIRDAVLNTLNTTLEKIAIGRKLEQLEPVKSSIETVPGYVSAANANTGTDLTSTGVIALPGFTGPNSIEFYINVINAIDNMILLDFIRDNQTITSTNIIDYSVTKTNDINIDMALVYYSIKYPTDSIVDSAKLEQIKNELNTNLFN